MRDEGEEEGERRWLLCLGWAALVLLQKCAAVVRCSLCGVAHGVACAVAHESTRYTHIHGAPFLPTSSSSFSSSLPLLNLLTVAIRSIWSFRHQRRPPFCRGRDGCAVLWTPRLPGGRERGGGRREEEEALNCSHKDAYEHRNSLR